MGAIEMHRPTRSEPANRIKNDLEGKARRVQPEEANISRFHFLYLVFFLFFFPRGGGSSFSDLFGFLSTHFGAGTQKRTATKQLHQYSPPSRKAVTDRINSQSPVLGASDPRLISSENSNQRNRIRFLMAIPSNWNNQSDGCLFLPFLWFFDSLILWFFRFLFSFGLLLFLLSPSPPPNPNQFWKSIRIETSQEGRRGWKSGEINQIRRIW